MYDLLLLIFRAYLPIYIASLFVLIPYLLINKHPRKMVWGVAGVHFIVSFSWTLLLFLTSVPGFRDLAIVNIALTPDFEWPVAPGVIVPIVGSLAIFWFGKI